MRRFSISDPQTPIRWYNILWRALRPFVIFLSALLLCAALVSFGWQKINETLIAAPQPDNSTPIAFTVESGSSLSKVSRQLEEAGLIRNRTFFKYYCDFAGLGQKIQAGDYSIAPNLDAYSVAQLLTTGDGKPTTAEITLVPGSTVEDAANVLYQSGVLSGSEVLEFLSICQTGEGVEDYYFISDEKNESSVSYRKYLLEGYLAPDTYEVYMSATPLSIIRKLLSQTDKVFDSETQEKIESSGLNMDQVLILASMVEKEGKQKDFAKVSAVFRNRLAKGMKLESDPTVHYATGIRRMSLTESDLATNSAYNTYLVSGLPAGPICNPSPAAIAAVLSPDAEYVKEGYLFFCSTDPDSGELVFSKTEKEHNAAVEKYRPLWEQYDQERGLSES